VLKCQYLIKASSFLNWHGQFKKVKTLSKHLICFDSVHEFVYSASLIDGTKSLNWMWQLHKSVFLIVSH